MADIVLAVPAEGAASFQRAKEAASEEVAARVREWSKVTLILDGVAYIPLRTEWMPPKVRKTADGVAVLLDSRTWPDKVRQAVAARKVVRVSRRVVGEFWKCIATCGLSEERKQSEAPAVAPGCVADDHVLPQNSAVEEIYPDGEILAQRDWQSPVEAIPPDLDEIQWPNNVVVCGDGLPRYLPGPW